MTRDFEASIKRGAATSETRRERVDHGAASNEHRSPTELSPATTADALARASLDPSVDIGVKGVADVTNEPVGSDDQGTSNDKGFDLRRMHGSRWGVLPGLVLTAIIVLLAALLNRVEPRLSLLTIAVALGVILANCGAPLEWARPGLNFAARRLLRLGVALLGFQIAFSMFAELGWPTVVLVVGVVACTFFGVQVLARAMGISRGLGLLVATGFSICGASAIAAVKGVADADEEEVTFAVALVTICGTLCIFGLPLAASVLGLGPVQFGTWAGASVHDVGQVVATASSGGPVALHVAVVVKLARVVLLAPIVVGTSLASRRRARGMSPAITARPPVLPLFVVAFLAAAALRTAGVVDATAASTIKQVQDLCLAAALVGLGSGVVIAKLRQVGGRAAVLGAASWALVAAVALLGVLALV